MAEFRSADKSRALNKSKVYQDTRTLGEQLKDTIPKWDYAIGGVVFLSLVPFVKPIALWGVIPAICTLARFSSKNRVNRSLPMKLPIQLGKQTDYNSPKPGQKNKFYNGQGTILIGNLRTDNTELWLTGKDMLTHMLLIGTTGAGKTETLVSLSSCTAFCMGGGTIYVDAKAAPKLTYQFATLARIFGREDDVRIISFITGDSGKRTRHWERLSNTTTPFAQGSANNAVQILSSLLPAGGGDNQYFLDRAISLLGALMPALVELRDMGVLNIYPSLIGDFISVKKFMELSENRIIIGDIEYKDIELTPPTLMIIRAFLKALPGFDANKSPEKQHEQVHTQFGFAEGYFARTLTSLSGTYGHIYQTELGEADFIDIVMHNRILIVLVPAMGLAPEERTVLGKIILSCIRAAMGKGLGSKGEGNRVDVLDALPVDLKIPTIIIVDEYAEVAVEGFAVTATQGRGLGMSVVFAGQDLAGFIRASEQEADMIFGNTKLKVLMALEDSDITWKKFKDLIGTHHVSESNGFEQDKSGMASYKKNMSATVKEVERVNFLDVKEQTEGQAHIMERSEIHKAQLFHHGIGDDDLVENTRINRMLKVLPPKPSVVKGLQEKIERNFAIKHVIEGELVTEKPSSKFSDMMASYSGDINNVKWPWDLCLSLMTEVIDTEQEQITDPVQPESTNIEPADIADISVPSENPNSSADDLSIGGDLMDDLLGEEPDKPESPIPVSPELKAPITPEKPIHNAPSTDSALVASDQSPKQSVLNKQVHDEVAVNTKAIDCGSPKEDSFISDALSKAENHWVFNNRCDADGIAKSNSLYKGLSEINTLTGQEPDKAEHNAANTVNSLTDSILYPSTKIETKKEDVDELWEILNSSD